MRCEWLSNIIKKMKVKHCFAPNCSSNSESEPNLTFHSLPSNERILQQWAKNMDKEEKILNAPKSTQKHYFICGKHFLDSCFQTYERKKLNRGAVPTIFNISKDIKPMANLKITSIFKRVSTKPIILNHQIVFPSSFGSIEDAVPPMLPQLNQFPTEIDLAQDSMDLDEKNAIKISVDIPELRPIRHKSNEVEICRNKIYLESIVPETPAASATKDSSLKVQDSMEQLPCTVLDVFEDVSRKPSFKFKNGSELIKCKPPRKHIHRLLMQAKKIISLLQKCEGNCMKLFNKHVTLFNSKVIQNLEKLNYMPAIIKTYMIQQVKKINMNNVVKYKKHEIPFYTAFYKSNKSAYQFLSKIFHLPSMRKLNDFLKNTKFESGLNTKLFNQLKRKSALLSPLDRYCTLLFKCIPLCSYLNYNNDTDTTEGFQVNGFERTCNIVNQCFIFFLVGLHKAWKQPIAYYFVSKQTKSLHYCIKEVISEIYEKTNFSVVASVSPLTSVNINAIQCLMAVDSKELVYEVNGHEIIHIYDPPSLLKLLRNQFINHDIVYEETRVAKWDIFVELLNLDGNDGSVKLTKLTNDHIYPSNTQKKKTVLAAELFSETVSSNILRVTSKSAASDSFDTAELCLFINYLFDSFNGTLYQKYRKNKLYGILSDSSGHFEFWDEASTTLLSFKFRNNKTGKLCISYIPEAFILNINNIKKIWCKLKNEGFKYLATKYLNLDPLESFHAVMRHFYRKNSTHPTYLQFQDSFKISIFNDKLNYFDSFCEEEEIVFICSLNPEIFNHPKNSFNTLSNTRLISRAIFKMVRNVHFYSAENIAKFLTKKVLNTKCNICVKVFCKDNVRMIAADNLIQQICLLQREVYKSITKYINQDRFIEKLYCFAEENWSFDFLCPQHKYEVKYKTITSVCLIMVKCFIEITNKMLCKKLSINKT